jgi:protein ImuB
MLWLALVFPDWPLQALFRNQAHACPLAVARRQRVCALDAAALAQGVRSGQGVADALAVAPTLLVRPQSADAEQSALREAAGCALRYTPRVVLEADGLLLDIAGSTRLFGGLGPLLRQLRGDLAAAGFHALSACAPTPRAARWLARATPGRCIDDVNALPGALAALPLQAMEADARILGLLADSGLHELGKVMKLPRDALARRDAAAVRTLIDQALGRLADPRPCFEAPQCIDSRLELPVPRHDTDVLLFAANRLFNACATRLAARHAGIESCRLDLEHEHHPPTTLTLTLGSPSRDARRMALLAREHLARLTLPEAVSALRLQATGLIDLAGRTDDLFGPKAASPGQRQEACALLVEHLRARLGRDKVYALSACADHRPERAQQAAEPGQAGVGASFGRRPLWLLAQPEALRTVDGMPRRSGPLQLISGPERIESGWWDSDDATCRGDALRDYFVALGAGHQRLWIYREHKPPYRWYLHGLFA